MFSTSRFIGSIVLSLAMTTAASAQFVSMTGEYTESNGFVVNIPNNQPLVTCGAGGNANATPTNDARCHGVRRTIYDPALGPLNFFTPANGVPDRLTAKTIMGGANVGDSFTVPTGFFGQDRISTGGLAVSIGGPVINNAVIWISSAFTARMPAAARLNSPPASTRVMNAQGTGAIAGQAGRPTGAPGTIVNVMDNTGSNDTGTLTYTEGPNKFGGTMAVLLDGEANLYIKTAAFNAPFPSAYTPVLALQHVGNPTVTLMERNGVGWNYPIAGGQVPGTVFGPTGTAIVPCNAVLPASPVGCNQPLNIPPVAGILDVGNFLPAATSTKYAFPWTTGTIVAVARAVRGAQGTFTETLTGMGYDTTAATPGVRNVGLVAGSYTNRTAGTGVQLASQIVGINIRLTPEPASAVALFAGVGLLGFAAARRGRA